MHKPPVRTLIAAAVLASAANGAEAAFTIDLSFSNLSATQQSYFTAAKSFWEGVISGYQGGTALSGLSIAAYGETIDGVGGILGGAGPLAKTALGKFLYAKTGEMVFDTADMNRMIAAGSFTDVIKHEMAHVIGFGTLWTANGVYVDGSGQFTGVHALSQYRVEFNQPHASYVPVELGGGSGTANGHWNEVDGGGRNTGITDPLGRDFKSELMTGWLDAPTFTSRTTIASFQDIGYDVVPGAVPEPAAYAMLLLGLGVINRQVRRRA